MVEVDSSHSFHHQLYPEGTQVFILVHTVLSDGNRRRWSSLGRRLSLMRSKSVQPTVPSPATSPCPGSNSFHSPSALPRIDQEFVLSALDERLEETLSEVIPESSMPFIHLVSGWNNIDVGKRNK
ncbi:unnamed protein product [Caenorhabditis auriculariae]|uniref:Uncharacterized protein n=1 Tax=Caenorhabditis auriculariae TaxID=2777116 RepID=A0A8S1HDW2_9PELO|nr:unnamed protein product [Caenorhabditis auriculariae]